MLDSKINIIYKSVEELIPYVNNPRDNADAIDKVASSIKNFGFKVPLVIDNNNEIITGHTRLLASKKLGIKEVPVIIAGDLTEAQVKAFRIADNKVSEYAKWDDDLLKIELEGLQDLDFDLEATGFLNEDLDNLLDLGFTDLEDETEQENPSSSLLDRFLIPPFSILDAKQGYWQERKKQWKALGIKSEEGRDVKCNASIDNFSKTRDSKGGGVLSEETSIFDPVMCEIAYKWFCPENGKIIDSFSGGSVRGIVAEKLGYEYTGIDLRQEQVDANYRNAEEIGVSPTWICDDSNNIDNYIEDETMDLYFTCPPYADLEVYSDDPRDLSNMDYNDFLNTYRSIINKTCKKLKQDRFAVIVVGEVRSKDGSYYNFVGDTIKAFLDAGMKYYNEAILSTAISTASLRAGRYMRNRKLAKVHQNVLVFYKGDLNNIKHNFGDIEIADLDEIE